VYEPLVKKGELHLRVLDRMRRKAYEEVPYSTPPRPLGRAFSCEGFTKLREDLLQEGGKLEL